MKCPNGHESAATDYCDTCGEAMGAAGGSAPDGSAADAATPGASGASGASGGSGSSLDLDGGPAAGTGSADGEAGGSTEAKGGGGDGAGGGGAAEGDSACPNCGIPNSPEALFCENCGYDYTTGQMPRREDPAALLAGASTAGGAAASPAPALDPPWVAEIWIDPAWYGQQESPDPLPSPGLPAVVPLRHTSLLIGRVSSSRGITPDIDCGNDNGVSRRHAQLTTDGRRWWVEDLASSNGTFVADATAPPPADPIPVGTKREIDADDRIYVGSWTRIVLRVATDGEA